MEHNLWEHTYILRSKGYIGYIPVNENYILKIRPKVGVKNVFRMLEYTYKLKSFELLKGLTNVESTEDFFERFVMVLAKRILDRNRKGLYCNYVQKAEELPHLRGRVKILPTTLSMLRGSTKAACRYEEHTSDLIENQILLWTLYQLRQFQIKRKDVKRVVRKAYRELIHKVSLKQINLENCVNRFYNKLNQDYRPLHGLCRFFLEHVGPGMEQGTYDFVPFVIHMPHLFESFVAEWLRENLPRRYKVTKQFSATFDSEGNFQFRIDLVITISSTGEVVCVLDTKYKRPTKPEDADISQIHTYAAKMETKRAFLVYPSQIITPCNISIKSIMVSSIVFNLCKDPDTAGKLFLDELLSYIQ